MRILLDTNAYVAFKRNHPVVSRWVDDAEKVYFSTVVAGELLYGFRNGSRLGHNTRELAEFLDSPYVALLPVTMDTAERYGRIATELRRAGAPIPSNDMWIAAHAMEVGAELVTFDRHFDEVAGLAFRNPATQGA